jgi:4-amino-4-deoxy-L-arabinose transferase-like glycosyltransferase
MTFKLKHYIFPIILILLSFFLFTYKIISIPPGLETDEGSIAYNSALISQTFRDQNGRFLPFFILSSDKIDWKQPVLIYLTAIYFKLFGTSLLIYKLVNVSVTLLTSFILYKILLLVFKEKKIAYTGVLLYITTPIIIITTRIGNESILPSLFSCLWLLSLLVYKQNKSLKQIIINAISLGIAFYSFKGMRIIVPTWTIISFFFIFIQSKGKNSTLKNHIFSKDYLKPITTFILFVSPFFLVTPILELKYAGAVFDRKVISIDSINNFLFYWLSNTNLAFWFTTPDIGKIYNVSKFGALLLVNLLPFVLGSFEALKKRTINTFVLFCFFATPFLFGLAHSLSYTHRLTASLPFIIILVINGFKSLPKYVKNKKYVFYASALFASLYILNISDFIYFYYFKYPQLNTTQEAFGIKTNQAFKELAKISKEYNLTPHIQENIYRGESDENKFYNIVYFNNTLKIWKLGEKIDVPSAILTENNSMEYFENSGIKLPHNYNILISQ